jgi:hypothetical protein
VPLLRETLRYGDEFFTSTGKAHRLTRDLALGIQLKITLRGTSNFFRGRGVEAHGLNLTGSPIHTGGRT